MMQLTEDLAARFAALTLGHVTREFPHKLDHVLDGHKDAQRPRDLHPIFYGSFDWHSCVHGWWQLMRLCRLFPNAGFVDDVKMLRDRLFTPENIAAERAYLSRPHAAAFERPYGWAWLMALSGEMPALETFARDFAALMVSYLGRMTYPIRTGTHFSSAFAMILAHRWAESRDPALSAVIERRARIWFLNDRDCQAWEPEGDAFLSPALIEAALLSQILPGPEFERWFDRFLPRISTGTPATLLTPAIVSDRSDGKIAHLDGLNLSRAWCWRLIGRALPDGHAVQAVAAAAYRDHLNAGLPHIAGDYAGEHWLATFALLALEAPRTA
ncbi:DUF2891 domain-containing protein [Pacificimonas sp. WHA3]|uniref:DUF2891 domain-containing protein n=1 Tax=Pacificimonas pallii TaxID=2827236 RepID=A0ABS6SI71_9SPHN|nr:DUF2891 domain-containing protein [Pacificimonas pallii]MBV7257748.1 DUF2891 domain-containing protein [Pacificimonas pallii]